MADIASKGTNLPSRLVFHGEGGVGKTSFAAHAPKPIFLLSQGETGLLTLMDAGQLGETPFVELTEWENTLAFIQELRTAEHDYKTVVLDVLDGFETLAKKWALRTKFDGDDGPKGWLNYSAGDRFVASSPWLELLVALDRLREERRMLIIGLAHTNQATYKNPLGPDYDRFVPNMYKDVWQHTFGWADIVLFGYHEIYTEKDKGATKAKAKGGQHHLLQTVKTATADAKNRHGLSDDISMGTNGKEAWDNFIAAIQAAKGKAGGA